MAAISGLQSPNPYAQSATRAPTHARTAQSTQFTLSTQGLVDQAISHHPSYSPDWMQEDHASAPQTAGIYSMKGELQNLPQANSAANEVIEPNSAVTDHVTFSSDFSVYSGSSSGGGKLTML